MELGCIVGQMVGDTKGNTKMIRNMGMEYMCGLMVRDMKENSNMDYSMAKEYSIS